MNTDLHWAAIKGDLKEATILMNRGEDILATCDNNKIPAYYAIRNGHILILELFLKYGLDINFKGCNGDSLLHIAVVNGEFAIMKLLLAKGADIQAVNDQSETTIDKARSTDYSQVINRMYNERFKYKSDGKNKPYTLTNDSELLKKSIIEFLSIWQLMQNHTDHNLVLRNCLLESFKVDDAMDNTLSNIRSFISHNEEENPLLKSFKDDNKAWLKEMARNISDAKFIRDKITRKNILSLKVLNELNEEVIIEDFPSDLMKRILEYLDPVEVANSFVERLKDGNGKSSGWSR